MCDEAMPKQLLPLDNINSLEQCLDHFHVKETFDVQSLYMHGYAVNNDLFLDNGVNPKRLEVDNISKYVSNF